MGDTAQFGGVRANFHGERRDARALRWRKRSSSDNNGTPQGVGDRARPGRRARTAPEAFASGVVRWFTDAAVQWGRARLGLGGSPSLKLCDHAVHVGGKRGKARFVCFRANPDDDGRRNIDWQDPRSRELAQPTLDPIPSYRRMPKSRNDQTDPRPGPGRTRERGSDGPNLEERGSDTLPLLRDKLQFHASCDARTSRKSERRVGRVRLRRTCPGCELSAASVPSSGGGQGSYDPISFPCAHEIRAS